VSAIAIALGEDELRALCGRLIAGAGDEHDSMALAAEPGLADEVSARLAAVGLRLIRSERQAPVCVSEYGAESLSELSLACLATCVLELADAPASKRPRLPVSDLWSRLGRPQGYSEAYLRRAGLGPLEARGMIRVVKPEQRAQEAYVVAGPALRAIDSERLRARIKTLAA
jgi:hypothetical protein